MGGLRAKDRPGEPSCALTIMGTLLSRLFTFGSCVGEIYTAAIGFAVLVGCVADDGRRGDAHRVLALLLFRPVEPHELRRRPRRRRRLAKKLPEDQDRADSEDGSQR